MKTNSLATLPAILTSSSLTAAHNNAKTRRQRTGVVKMMTTPPPPDEKTIRELNALANKYPFCALHKVKRHDTL